MHISESVSSFLGNRPKNETHLKSRKILSLPTDYASPEGEDKFWRVKKLSISQRMAYDPKLLPKRKNILRNLRTSPEMLEYSSVGKVPVTISPCLNFELLDFSTFETAELVMGAPKVKGGEYDATSGARIRPRW